MKGEVCGVTGERKGEKTWTYRQETSVFNQEERERTEGGGKVLFRGLGLNFPIRTTISYSIRNSNLYFKPL